VLGETFENVRSVFSLDNDRHQLESLQEVAPSISNQLVVVFLLSEGIVCLGDEKVENSPQIWLITL
jgi:hypothetical protein